MKIVFTPDWFLNNDVLIETFSFFILVTFFLLALKSYSMSRKKSVLYLGMGFFLIALGQLAAIVTKLVLYYDTSVVQEIGQVIITSNIVKSVDIFYYAGFFFSRFFTLLGLYAIFKIPHEKKISSDFFLAIYLLLIVALLSHNFYYLYNFTAFVILVPIIRQYYLIYKKEKMTSTAILIFAFILLAVAQFTFMFSQMGNFYVIAQNIQLASYLILLVLIVKILRS